MANNIVNLLPTTNYITVTYADDNPNNTSVNLTSPNQVQVISAQGPRGPVGPAGPANPSSSRLEVTTNVDTALLYLPHIGASAAGSNFFDFVSPETRIVYAQSTTLSSPTPLSNIITNNLSQLQLGSESIAGSILLNGNQGSTKSLILANSELYVQSYEKMNFTASAVEFLTPITSSVISASGDLSALDLNLFGGGLSIKNQGAQSYARFYCENNNAHYTEVKAQPHINFSGNPTMLLPAYDFDFASPTFNANISANNLSGTNTGDQDLSSYIQNSQTGSFLVAADTGSLATKAELNTSSSILQADIDAKASIISPSLVNPSITGSLIISRSSLTDEVIISSSLIVTGSTSLRGSIFASGLQSNLLYDELVTVQTGSSNRLGFRSIDSRVFDTGFFDSFFTGSAGVSNSLALFNDIGGISAGAGELNFIPDSTKVNSLLRVGIGKSGNYTDIGGTAITSSVISASSEIIGDTKRDSFVFGCDTIAGGIAQRSSYHLKHGLSLGKPLLHNNFNVVDSISSSVYYQLILPCDDMDHPSSIDISGIISAEATINAASSNVTIDLYTASVTPGNIIQDPLNFGKAFTGDPIAFNSNLTTQSIYFTQSFDIKYLDPNCFMTVALSNGSSTTPVTTDTDIKVNLKLSRNYKVKN